MKLQLPLHCKSNIGSWLRIRWPQSYLSYHEVRVSSACHPLPLLTFYLCFLALLWCPLWSLLQAEEIINYLAPQDSLVSTRLSSVGDIFTLTPVATRRLPCHYSVNKSYKDWNKNLSMCMVRILTVDTTVWRASFVSLSSSCTLFTRLSSISSRSCCVFSVVCTSVELDDRHGYIATSINTMYSWLCWRDLKIVK